MNSMIVTGLFAGILAVIGTAILIEKNTHDFSPIHI